MAIRYETSCAVLDGDCTVEEAGDFAEWLIAERARTVDLGACTGLHSAILQSLMALRPPIIAAPADPVLARWLGGVLTVSRPDYVPSEADLEPAPASSPNKIANKARSRTATATGRRSKKVALS